jgi:hypothetical protein
MSLADARGNLYLEEWAMEKKFTIEYKVVIHPQPLLKTILEILWR